MDPTPGRAAIVRAEAWRLGLVAAAAAAVVMAVVVASDGRASLFRNDAELYWLVGRDPFGDGSFFGAVEGFPEQYGVSYRYGRILYPLLAWALAGGSQGVALEYALMAVDVASFGLAVAFASELVARRGVPVSRGLSVLVVPAMWFSCVLTLSEPLVLALILLTYVLASDGRERAAMVTGSLLLLARESAALALVPLVVAAWRRRDRARLATWALVPVPLLLWWTWVRVRVGNWPFLDPSVSRREAMGLPGAGPATVAGEGLRPAHVVAFVLAAGTIAAAVWAWRRARWEPVTSAALLFSALLLFLGPNAWRYPGESIRLMGPAQALVILSFAGGRRARVSSAPAGKVPAPATPSGT